MEQRKYRVEKRDLTIDLLLLMDGIFDGEITTENDRLTIKFRNGQVFQIEAKECEKAE